MFNVIILYIVICFVSLSNEIQLLKVGENYLLLCCNVSRISYGRLQYKKQTKTELSTRNEVNIENSTTVISLNRTDGLQGRVLMLNPNTGFELYEWYVVCVLGYEDSESDETCILVRPCDCPCTNTAYKKVTLQSVKTVMENGAENVTTNVTITNYGSPLPSSEKFRFELYNLDTCNDDDDNVPSDEYVPRCKPLRSAGFTVSDFQANQTKTYDVETTKAAKYKLMVKIVSTNKPYHYDHAELPFDDTTFILKPFIWNLTENDVLMTKIELVPFVNSSVINENINEMNSITLCSRVNKSSPPSHAYYFNGFISHLVLMYFTFTF